MLEPIIEGVVTGCDRNQEWLLPWWWDHFSEHNSFPVAFANFGMSEKSVAWCKERGLLFPVPEVAKIEEKKISRTRKKLWTDYFGEDILLFRKVSLRKPLALINSPFPRSIWIDLDCRVRGNLSPLFQLLREGTEIAMRKEGQSVQVKHREKGFLKANETAYNSGVVPYKRESKVLSDWAAKVQERSEEFSADQHALASTGAIIKELSPLYNWSPSDGSNPDALIYHFHGSLLKEPAFLFFFN